MPDTFPLYGERAGTVLKEAKYKNINIYKISKIFVMKILNIKSNLSQKNSMYKNTDLYLRHVAEKKI